MKDIETRKDIELLVDRFYDKVKQDEVIGYIFNNAENFSWEKHIPIMYSFWETVLFGKGGYKGNPILTHILLNKKEKLTEAHFGRWLDLFYGTLDELFQGPVSADAKKKALSMKKLMLFKIAQSENKNFIQ